MLEIRPTKLKVVFSAPKQEIKEQDDDVLEWYIILVFVIFSYYVWLIYKLMYILNK